MRTLNWDQEIEFNDEIFEVEVTVVLEGSMSEGYNIESLFVHAPGFDEHEIAKMLMEDEQKILDKVEAIINS